MKEGNIIEVNYTGRVVASDEVFDTTIEKKAVEAGIFNAKVKYRPVVVVVGENDLLKGLDDALKGLKAGEGKKVSLKPEKAFGERRKELIAVLPLQEFKRQKMNPIPGLVVEANGRQGRVQSVSGGRVRVDFNHPLSGKEVEYDLKVEKELKGTKEQVEALFEKYFGVLPAKERKLKITGKVVEAALDAKYSAAMAPLKTRFSDLVTKHVKGIEKVRFVEEFKENKKEKKQ